MKTLEKLISMMDQTSVIKGKESGKIYFIHSTFATLVGYLENEKFVAATGEAGLDISMDDLDAMQKGKENQNFELLF